MSEKISKEHLEKKAILYVRQSTGYQVENNQESRRLQYAMKKRINDLGFQQVEVVDEDMAVSASGVAHRSGFELLITEVCLGKVGLVASRQVCRLSRNNTDWHRLVEMCRHVNTLLADLESVYDPRNSNDRLLLGVKGNLSTYELDVLRQRATDALRSKAERGELYRNLPAGYVRGSGKTIEKDPDLRVQHAIELVFRKFLDIGAQRQTVLWFWENNLEIPVMQHSGCGGWDRVWKLPTESNVNRILKNPIYAGVYAHGRKKVIYEIRDEEVNRSVRKVPMEKWDVLIPCHHEGYISWETFERIRNMLFNNTNAAFQSSTGSARKGASILVGLMRCSRCGGKLSVTYTGTNRDQRYRCTRPSTENDKRSCLSFGGKLLDAAVAEEVLRVVEPGAMEAAAAAAADIIRKREEVLVALRLDLEAAQYVAEHARRQYDSMDPENRLVAAQLERRWNDALVRVEDLERRIDEQDSHLEVETLSFELMNLADDLPRVWNDPQTDIRLKKRIVRTLIEEVIVDLDSEESAIKAVIHWNGGVHTELSVQRRKRGQHGQATSKDTIDAVRVLSRVCSDRFIAQLLSRNGLRTGKNNPWSRRAVKGVRHSYDIPVHTKEGQAEQGWMTLSQAAAHVGVAPRTLRLAVERGAVEALHPLPDGPWVLNRKDLELPEVKERFAKIRTRSSEKPNFDDGNLMIPGVS